MGSGTAFNEQTAGSVEDYTHPEKQKIPPQVKRKKVIVISGPTAVGKTALSLQVAREVGGEIVSADSMQVYREMDIGTAKIDTATREEIPHHLIDIRDLKETFNVADFYQEAIKAIRQVHLRGKLPIVVGGTGFYIHALLYGPPSGPPSVPEIRNRLEEEMAKLGSFHLYQKLQQLDPDYALSITQNDRQKIIRALEIIALTNQKVSFFDQTKPEEVEEYDFRCWFVYMEKDLLYAQIEKRCETMLDNGFLDEVKRLKEGLEKNLSAAQAIGYRQALQYLSSEQTEEDMKEFVTTFKQASRKLAKKQFTWFRKEPLFRWLNVGEISLESAAEMLIQDIQLSF